MSTNQCENCAAPLTVPYCSACGQHAHASVRSLRGLLHDALHDLTHVESHFLATLWILVRRPGQLTGAYFAGKRARYALPFRLYLILFEYHMAGKFGLGSFAKFFDDHLKSVQVKG